MTSHDELWPGKGGYTAVYARDEGGQYWNVYVRGHKDVIHSFARSIAKARENIREALGLFYDDAGTAVITDDFRLDSDIEELLARIDKSKQTYDELAETLRRNRRTAVRRMKRSGLGTRDIADIVGLSQQRVSQIDRDTY